MPHTGVASCYRALKLAERNPRWDRFSFQRMPSGIIEVIQVSRETGEREDEVDEGGEKKEEEKRRKERR